MALGILGPSAFLIVDYGLVYKRMKIKKSVEAFAVRHVGAATEMHGDIGVVQRNYTPPRLARESVHADAGRQHSDRECL